MDLAQYTAYELAVSPHLILEFTGNIRQMESSSVGPSDGTVPGFPIKAPSPHIQDTWRMTPVRLLIYLRNDAGFIFNSIRHSSSSCNRTGRAEL